MALLHWLKSATSPTPVSLADPIPVSGTVGGAAVSSTNPQPIVGSVQPLVTTSDWFATGDVQNGALTDAIKAAAGASLYNTLTRLTISAGTLGAAATLSIKDGAAGTVKWQLRIQTTGVSQSFSFDPPLASTANTLLEIATTDPTSGLIYWSASGSVVG